MSKRKGPGGGAHHPWQPLRRAPAEAFEAIARRMSQRGKDIGLSYEGHDAYYDNDRYAVYVTFWRDTEGNVLDAVKEISFKRHDRQWPNDWRDAMRIKNEVAGPDVEAVELYPAQSRVVDTANQRFLWCYPPGARPTWDGEHLIGFPLGARVDDGEGPDLGATQRPFGPADEPGQSWDEAHASMIDQAQQ